MLKQLAMATRNHRWAAAAAVVVLSSAPVFAGKVGSMAAPELSCAGASQASTNLQVCAGATGAAAGFSIQWMTARDYGANGNAWYLSDDPRLCKASFSGNASLSRYDLAPGECETVSIGDLLFDNGASSSCLSSLASGTGYVFRSFAHATSTLGRSDFTSGSSCSTLPGGSASGCTRPHDDWQVFNPTACVANPGSSLCVEWPVTSLTLGAVSYTVDELVAILGTPALDNGLLALAHQLIATRLNVASGADGSSVAATIAAADGLIGGLVVPPVGDGHLDPGVTAAYAATLASFNEGAIGPGVCVPRDPGVDD